MILNRKAADVINEIHETPGAGKYDISPNVIRRINPLFKRDIEMKQKD